MTDDHSPDAVVERCVFAIQFCSFREPRRIVEFVLNALQPGDILPNGLVVQTKGMLEAIAKQATAVERSRCASIVQAARHDKVDGDFRAIVSMIECGWTLEKITSDNG